MVIILTTLNRKVKLKLIRQWLNKLILHNSNPKKQALPIIHKVKYIGRKKVQTKITPILYYQYGKTQTLSSILNTDSVMVIRVSRQKFSCLGGYEGSVLSMNVTETSLRKPLWPRLKKCRNKCSFIHGSERFCRYFCSYSNDVERYQEFVQHIFCKSVNKLDISRYIQADG